MATAIKASLVELIKSHGGNAGDFDQYRDYQGYQKEVVALLIKMEQQGVLKSFVTRMNPKSVVPKAEEVVKPVLLKIPDGGFTFQNTDKFLKDNNLVLWWNGVKDSPLSIIKGSDASSKVEKHGGVVGDFSGIVDPHVKDAIVKFLVSHGRDNTLNTVLSGITSDGISTGKTEPTHTSTFSINGHLLSNHFSEPTEIQTATPVSYPKTLHELSGGVELVSGITSTHSSQEFYIDPKLEQEVKINKELERLSKSGLTCVANFYGPKLVTLEIIPTELVLTNGGTPLKAAGNLDQGLINHLFNLLEKVK